MIFQGVKAVTLPEGPVKKLRWAGRVLWEKPDDPAAPTLLLTYEPATRWGVEQVKVTMIVAGIEEALIRKVYGVLQSYSESQGAYVSKYPIANWEKTVQDDATLVYVGWISTWYDPASMNQPRILGELTYTHGDGNARVISAAAEYV